MMILPNSEQMRQVDQCAINEFNIPGIVLMENAGMGTITLMERILGSLAHCFIPIFIGPGNNGGDGLVIARHLYQRHATPLLVFLVDPKHLKGDSATNLRIVEKLNIKTLICTSTKELKSVSGTIEQMTMSLGSPAAMIDAIFGTGLDRNIEGHFSKVIESVNNLSRAYHIPVIAVDTPSGLSSDSGKILGNCIRAHTTATYGYAKIGQVLPSSKGLVGDLQIIDIGIPHDTVKRVGVDVAAVDQHDHQKLGACLGRSVDSHKGSLGHLLILGGSAGKTGAALLAARGAIRSGSGLVSICAPSGLNTIYESSLAEAMTIVVETQSFLSIDDLDTIADQLIDKTCVVIGPGIGQHVKTAELVVELYHRLTIPMVIDADALNILAQRKKMLPASSGPRIFTPHPGEMARLTGRSSAAVQADRCGALRSCFEDYKTPDSELIILLKGSATLTTDGDTVWVNLTGNPGMATGGMGDVLSGLIASLICQGMSPVDAARYGAYLHGLSGDRLEKYTGIGFSATDLADELSPTLAHVMDE